MSELTEMQARLVSLKKARDSGTLDVRHGDTSVTYRSLKEINEIILALEGDIAGLAGTTSTRGPKYIHQTSKGL